MKKPPSLDLGVNGGLRRAVAAGVDGSTVKDSFRGQL